MIRVLAVASEIFPLVKTGGLADVTGALPLALQRLSGSARGLAGEIPVAAAGSPVPSAEVPVAALKNPIAATGGPVPAAKSPIAAPNSPIGATGETVATADVPDTALKSPIAAAGGPVPAAEAPDMAPKSPVMAGAGPPSTPRGLHTGKGVDGGPAPAMTETTETTPAMAPEFPVTAAKVPVAARGGPAAAVKLPIVTASLPVTAPRSPVMAGAGPPSTPRGLHTGKGVDGGPAPTITDATATTFAVPYAPGVRVTTMVPGYPAVLNALRDAVAVHRFADLFGGPATVLRGTASGLDLLAVDAPHLFARDGNPYLGPDGAEWADNGLRFAGLGAAAAALAAGIVPGMAFDIVHAHDWQAAMAVVYLHFHDGPRPGTVLTVHNLAFQGRYPARLFPRLGLPAAAFSLDGLEYHGDVSFLKGGLSYADRVTTVSPTYAREITGIENGMGLDGLLRYRSPVLSGIMNGIDDTVWNPATDPLIPLRYGPGWLGGRTGNKLALQRRMGLDADADALLIGVISRLTSQKGLDMLLDQIDHFAATGMQLALLGSGEPGLEQAFSAAAEWHLGSVGCVLGYDEELAHLIEAGSDALLVPSRFEPCGLTQLYALRYGAIPVVSRVGGLADSVIDANQAALAAGVATGIQFWPPTPEALGVALDRLAELWRDRPAWERMQHNAMAAEVSWRGPAARYVALYQSILADQP